MKAMKFLSQVLCSVIYGALASWLLWLIFYWLTPVMMNVGWIIFILYLMFATGFVTGVISIFSTALAVPMLFMVKNNMVAKVIIAASFIWQGYEAIKLPWISDHSYTFLMILIAISISLTVLAVFSAMIMIAFTIDKKESGIYKEDDNTESI